MTTIGVPLLATYLVAWPFSGLDFWAPDGVQESFPSHMKVFAISLVFSVIAGWPVMALIVMPCFAWLRRRRRFNPLTISRPGWRSGSRSRPSISR